MSRPYLVKVTAPSGETTQQLQYCARQLAMAKFELMLAAFPGRFTCGRERLAVVEAPTRWQLAAAVAAHAADAGLDILNHAEAGAA